MLNTRFFTISKNRIIASALLVIFSASLFSVSIYPAFAQTAAETRRAQLEAELVALEKEIAEKEAILNEQKKQTGTIQKDVNILRSQIDNAKLKIKSRTLAIEKINKEIGQKETAIQSLTDEMGRERESLSHIIKKTNELDQQNTLHLLLSAQDVSNFYSDFDTYGTLKEQLNGSVTKIKQAKVKTEEQKNDLQDKQAEELSARLEVERQKKLVEQSEAEKKRLLSLSKAKEKEYETVLKEREKRRNEIRSALFALRDSPDITFGVAYNLAKEAEQLTGIRPAFLLSVITQESNLGKNVGTCNRAGDPASKSYKTQMPGPAEKAAGRSSRDDQTIFLEITKALGRDPETTPVSCRIGNSGWGGAMGPAQFIPTTWKSISATAKSKYGVTLSDPWSPHDSFMASAIYLTQLGGKNSTSAERNAACRYYSGRACDSKKPANAFYGDQVIARASTIQKNMIDPLENL